MKKIITLLGTTLLLAAVGLTTTIATALSANVVSARAQVTPEKLLDEEEVAALTPSADDPITGEWDVIADANGQPFPFTLTLKLEGDKVTGSSESQLGSATISNGIWDGNKLTFSPDSPGGSINMNAEFKDGKLVGEFEYAGQLTGKWEAKRK